MSGGSAGAAVLVFTLMFRFILLLAAVVLLFAAFPSLLESIRHVLGLNRLPQNSTPASAPRKNPHPDTDLKRDPVCGTLVYAGSAFQKAGRGETLYFCSKTCRDEYKG